MTTTENGAAPAPSAQGSRPYTMMPAMTHDEESALQAGGNDPGDYAVVLCPSAAAPQPAQGPQGPQVVQILDPATREPTGETGMVFLVPVVVPLALPTVAQSSIVLPGGAPAGTLRLEGPIGAVCRVLIPRASMTAAASAELASHERMERAAIMGGDARLDLAGLGVRDPEG